MGAPPHRRRGDDGIEVDEMQNARLEIESQWSG